MATVHQVNPNDFIKTESRLPANGRGAWNRGGIGFDYRYSLSEDPAQRIGTLADKSLSHWAVAAGSFAIQERLVQLRFMAPMADSERGIFGPRTKQAVIEFQRANKDPKGGERLDDDGTVGMTDARALFCEALFRAEKLYGIPNRLLLGETIHESSLDPGAVGYYIYYPEYRGVDRGASQINSLYNPQVTWLAAYSPAYSVDWSGKRLRSYFDSYRAAYPKTSIAAVWDAAVCAHNNPSAARKWAANGSAPTMQAADYVAAVKTAIF